MQEFAHAAGQQLASLPDKPEKAALLEQAVSLKNAIDVKAAGADVSGQARRLAAALLAAYPVPVAPSTVPSLQAAWCCTRRSARPAMAPRAGVTARWRRN